MSDFDRHEHIAKQKNKISKIRKDIKSGKMKTGRKGESVVEKPDQNVHALRNELAQEYNRLIREGDPETKELREQIHEQIQKLEEEVA